MKFFKNFDFNFFGKKPKVEKQYDDITESSHVKPYKNILYSNNTITIITKEGVILSAPGNREKLAKIMEFSNLEDMRNELYDVNKVVVFKEDNDVVNELAKHRDEVLEFLGDDKFVTKSDGFYLKGINLVLPDIIINTFIELKKAGKEDELSALEMFWHWTALNPIENSRNDLFNFIKNNDVKLTSNGLLELYRRVNKVAADTTFPEFVSNSWLKTKSYKKSPKNYDVYFINDIDVNGLVTIDYKLVHLDKVATPEFQSNNHVIVGNLDDLFKSLEESDDNLYTDNHTKKKQIRIGQVYKEDESNIDLDNTRDCSSGLHVGSQSFMFDGFGDTGVLVLVNPMFVRSVPASYTNKMRVSEMMIVAKLDIDDYKKSVHADEMNDFSELYATQSIEELSKMINNNSFDKMVCQDNVTPISITDIKSVISKLQSKIVLF